MEKTLFKSRVQTMKNCGQLLKYDFDILINESTLNCYDWDYTVRQYFDIWSSARVTSLIWAKVDSASSQSMYVLSALWEGRVCEM